MQAAAQVFGRWGVSGATTDRIAARAGVSVGSLYQYFSSKRDVLDALAIDRIDEGFNALQRILERTEREQLTERLLAAAAERHLGARAALHRILFEQGESSPVVRQHLRERQRAFVAALAARLSAEGHRAPEDAAQRLVHATEGLLFGAAAEPAQTDPRTWAEQTRPFVELLG